MTDLKDVIAYLAGEYPHHDELSNARLTKLVFLSDWKHAMDNGSQITGISWFFDDFGPFVWDVKAEAARHPELFSLEDTENAFGGKKLLISLVDRQYTPDVGLSEQAAMDHVIRVTRPLSFKSFIRLVYSTYPITNSSRYSFLDLAQMAADYRGRGVKRDLV